MNCCARPFGRVVDASDTVFAPLNGWKRPQQECEHLPHGALEIHEPLVGEEDRLAHLDHVFESDLRSSGMRGRRRVG